MTAIPRTRVAGYLSPGTCHRVPVTRYREHVHDDPNPSDQNIDDSTPVFARRFTRRHVVRVGSLSLGTLGTLSLGSLTLGTSLTGLLSACGGTETGTENQGGSGDSGTSGTVGDLGPIDPSMALVQRWVPDQLTPGFVRLPISLADDAGLLNAGPDVLTGKILNYLDNSVVVDGLSATRMSIGQGTPPFWVFTATLTEPDVYALVVEGGPEEGAALQISSGEFNPVPRVGQKLPALETPTVDDRRGVAVICTRTPEPCPFHDVTLSQALGTGKRVALLVGTPAHCQTAVCAPVLDSLIDIAGKYPDVTFVHVDVYADEAATEVAPAVNDLSLTFEPVLWITDDAGTITHRFEGVWAISEVSDALGSAALG